MPLRSSFRPARLGATLLTLVLPAPIAAQQVAVPVRTLAKPEAVFSEPFTQIAGLRELKDGTVIVADLRDRTLQRINLKTGSAEALSREGSGPGEYAFPMGVYALPGDSTAIYDLGNQRYLVLGPAGQPSGTFRIEEGPGGGMVVLRAAQGTDAKGRFYYSTRGERRGGRPGAGPPEFSDTGKVIRYDRATMRFDTLGGITVPKPKVEVSGGQNNQNVRVRPSPMAPEDAWHVAPDGRVGVARVADNRVEWWGGDGKTVAGARAPYTPIRVTEADKQAWWEQWARGRVQVENRNGVVRAGPVTGAAPPMDPSLQWPATKPPFPANAVKVSARGELWLLRARPAEDPIPTYDVFDAQARWVRQVRLPRDTRLVAFGQNAVYLARKDADDLEYLERYRL